MKPGLISACIATALSVCAAPANAATFEWVNGKVTGFLAQLPDYTTVIVGEKVLRFCDPKTGKEYQVNPGNLQSALLKTAMLNNRDVEVGVQNFGADARSGSVKMCIERVRYY